MRVDVRDLILGQSSLWKVSYQKYVEVFTLRSATLSSGAQTNIEQRRTKEFYSRPEASHADAMPLAFRLLEFAYRPKFARKA